MDCTLIARQEFAERYALGKLTPEQRELYERHYFECERCFNELQQLLTIRRELEAQPLNPPVPERKWGWHRIGWWPVLAAAAAVVAVIILSPVYEISVPGHQGDGNRTATLAELARVVPPGYEAPVLRGVHDAAGTAFREGMQAYLAGNFDAAAERLGEARAANPVRPDAVFFLGASELLANRPDAARAEFESLIAMGETPFTEEAHFYLGKTLLLLDRLADAEREFQFVAAGGGALQTEAQEVLDALAGLETKDKPH